MAAGDLGDLRDREALQNLLSSEGRMLNRDLSLTALLDVQKSLGKTEAELVNLKGAVADHGKKINWVVRLLIYVAGVLTAQGISGKTLLDLLKGILG